MSSTLVDLLRVSHLAMSCAIRLQLWAWLLVALTCPGADWPQFLGPNRNGVYPGKDVIANWDKEGPPALWRKKVGQGFSGPVSAEGKLILFHRVNNEEVVECFQATDGTALWKFGYRTTYRDDFGMDEGPRATPAIRDGKIYTFGADGAMHCLDLASGKPLWSVDAKARFTAQKGFFGMACSPLVDERNVYINIGGSSAGVIALSKETGVLAWKATEEEASYSSPVPAAFNGSQMVLFFTREGLVGLEAGSGKLEWRYPWRSRTHASVNAATPLVIGDMIFLSASYETGAVLLRPSGRSLQKMWSSDEVLSNHYATSVHRDGYLYGFHGRQEFGPTLRCVELKSGSVKWNAENLAAGTVTLAGELLIILLEDGRLMSSAASPAGFKKLGEAQILPNGVRAHPAIANGRLYARSKDTLVCVDLRQR